jgi:hypothetical protein
MDLPVFLLHQIAENKAMEKVCKKGRGSDIPMPQMLRSRKQEIEKDKAENKLNQL